MNDRILEMARHLHHYVSANADDLIRIATISVGMVSGAASGVSAGLSLGMLGLSISGLLGAFSGAMVSLSFLTVKSKKHAVAILFGGTLSGGYMAPALVVWLGMSDSVLPGASFGIGATLQWAVPLLLEKFSRKP